MPLNTKTFDELHAMALGQLRGSLPEANLAPGTDFDIAARLAATMALMNQAHAKWLADQITPRTADADMVEAQADVRGMGRLPATKMQGKVMLTASTGTSTQSTGSALAAGDGRTYATTADATIINPGWSGKTAAAGSTARRLFVLPDVSGMSAGEVVEVNGQKMAIRSVLTAINAIDLYMPLSAPPSPSDAIDPARGCVASIEADEAGAAGMQLEGDSLTVSSPASGVDSSSLLLVAGGAADEETPAQLGARVQSVLVLGGSAGSATQLRATLREYEAQRVEDAVIIPGLRGIGTVDVFVVGPSGGRVVPLDDGLMLAALLATLPAQYDVALRSIEYDTATDVELGFTAAPGLGADWIGGVGYLALTGTSHTTSRVYVTTDPTLSGCRAGSRVVLPMLYGTRWKTEQRVVASVGFSTDWYVDLTVSMPSAPTTAATPRLYPGGPLVDAVVAAIEGVFDLQGPSALKNTLPTAEYQRIPADNEGWPSRLVPSELEAAAMRVVGVDYAVLDTPTTQVIPALGKTAALGKLTIVH